MASCMFYMWKRGLDPGGSFLNSCWVCARSCLHVHTHTPSGIFCWCTEELNLHLCVNVAFVLMHEVVSCIRCSGRLRHRNNKQELGTVVFFSYSRRWNMCSICVTYENMSLTCLRFVSPLPAVCWLQCQNGGACQRPNTCSCPEGWMGRLCEERKSLTTTGHRTGIQPACWEGFSRQWCT